MALEKSGNSGNFFSYLWPPWYVCCVVWWQ